MTHESEVEQLKRLQAMIERQEDLDPELEYFLEEDGPLGSPAIRHPLVYSVLHSPQLNAMVNESLRAKREACALSMKEQNWHRYVYLHERPHRLDAFLELVVLNAFKDDPDNYWRLLGDIWTDSENIWQQEDVWRRLLTDDIPGRHHMMTADEQEELAECFEDVIPVYRGYSRPDRLSGMSWTTNSVVAKFFARRFSEINGDRRFVAHGEVRKSDVLAYFTGRSEHEIVVDPSLVKNIDITEINGV